MEIRNIWAMLRSFSRTVNASPFDGSRQQPHTLVQWELRSTRGRESAHRLVLRRICFAVPPSLWRTCNRACRVVPAASSSQPNPQATGDTASGRAPRGADVSQQASEMESLVSQLATLRSENEKLKTNVSSWLAHVVRCFKARSTSAT